MSREHIDALALLDLEKIPLSDLRFHYGTFQAGRKNSSRAGVQTDIGDIEADVWQEAVERVAMREFEGWLVDSLEEHYAARKWESSAKKIRRHALELYASRIFENELWVDYLSFNRKYNPGELAGKQLVTVVADCCGKPGEMTRRLFESKWAICPICGRTAEVREMNGTK